MKKNTIVEEFIIPGDTRYVIDSHCAIMPPTFKGFNISADSITIGITDDINAAREMILLNANLNLEFKSTKNKLNTIQDLFKYKIPL